jgi:hypothetical protein
MKRATLLAVLAILSGCGPSYEECKAKGMDYYYNMVGDSRCMKPTNQQRSD